MRDGDAVDECRFAHISTVVTTPPAFRETVGLLTRHDWHGPTTHAIFVLGERKTCRVSVVLLTGTDAPLASFTSALEQIAPALDGIASSPVLARQSFDVAFWDLAEWQRANAVRLTRLNIVPSGVEVLSTIGRAAVARLRSTTPGFRGAIALSNAASGKAIFIELFTTRAALRDSEVTAYFDARNAREAGVLTVPPEHEVYQLHPLASSN